MWIRGISRSVTTISLPPIACTLATRTRGSTRCESGTRRLDESEVLTLSLLRSPAKRRLGGFGTTPPRPRHGSICEEMAIEQLKQTAIPEHAVVELLADVPDHGLRAGERGTVVAVYKHGEAYEVEFID